MKRFHIFTWKTAKVAFSLKKASATIVFFPKKKAVLEKTAFFS
jgi:hypothetical protein